MPDPEVNADILKNRLASFAPLPADNQSALACSRCGAPVTPDRETCQSCGAACSSQTKGKFRVATAAPELTASRKVYDPYEHVVPPYAVPVADGLSDEPEDESQVAPDEPSDRQEADHEQGEAELERRDYRRVIRAALLAGVLGLTALFVWHGRGQIRQLSSSIHQEISSEWAAFKGGNEVAQSKQPTALAQPSAPRKSGNSRLQSRQPVEKASVLHASAPETGRNPSPALMLASDSPVSVRPALTSAAVSPMRIAITPRDSLQLLIHSVPPIYPAQAREHRIEGSVAIKAVISREGTIAELQVVSGSPVLVPAAMEAVRQWRYRPYFLNGEAHEVETTIVVDFSLAKEKADKN